MFMTKEVKCPICNTDAVAQADYDRNLIFYTCPICGRFQLDAFKQINRNHLASYLIYNAFHENAGVGVEYRYHTVLDKEICDKYKEEFDKGNNIHGRPVHMDEEMIENWYPKTFSEKIDYILLYFNSRIKHLGQQVSFSFQELLSASFIDRKEYKESPVYDLGSWEERSEDDCEHELRYMLDYLVRCSYIEYAEGPSLEEWADISLAPDGYARIDVLQKNSSRGRNVLVAMKFGGDTKKLREAIREGIKNAEYHAIFIDEVQHNDFITPELLKHIRDSKFVVVDLTHQNNGAYFEEGYAMGLGKAVIQLCQKDTKLHFDIAQKNTIMWDNEEDIPERLTNRIKATID